MDPGKQTRDREEIDYTLKRYLDMNRLALQAVAPGGIFLTCSCTGLVSESDFLETLWRARRIALASGLRHAYVGNVHDEEADSTYCSGSGRLLIARDWYELTHWGADGAGRCRACGTPCPGVFEGAPGGWGARRAPPRLAEFRPGR